MPTPMPTPTPGGSTIALPERCSGELKNVIKNNFRILKKQYAYLQTILKAPVKFEKDWPKTVGGVAGRRYILPIHFCSIRA